MGDANDRRCTKGTCFLLALESFVEMQEKLTIILSTTEVEYIAIDHCTKKVVWFRQLLADVRYVQE